MHERTNSSNYRISNNNHRSRSYSVIDSAYKRETSNIAAKEKKSFSKRILLVDDDPDMTLVFSIGLQDEGFEVYTYNDPLLALSQFKPGLYDLLLVDINMPNMNGFELCNEILKIDINIRVCFITAGGTNIEVLRELYPTLSIGCFIKKPVTIEYLVRRVKAELD
jgi:two-component system response regulator ChvI